MKHPNEYFTTAMKMTGGTLLVCSAQLAPAKAASATSALAICDRHVGINLGIDAVTPKPAPLARQPDVSNCFRPVLHEK